MIYKHSREDKFAQKLRFLVRIPTLVGVQPLNKNKIEIRDNEFLSFQKLDGLGSETEVIEHREGSGPITNIKLPGLTDYEELILEKGITFSIETVNQLHNWFDALEGGAERDLVHDVEIFVLEREFDKNVKAGVGAWWAQKLSGAISGLSGSSGLERLNSAVSGRQSNPHTKSDRKLIIEADGIPRTPLKAFILHDALPLKFEVDEIDAEDSRVNIEMLSFEYSGFEIIDFEDYL